MRIMTPEEVRRDNARAEASAAANVQDNSRRDAAEEAIVRLIAGLAVKYDAVQDVLAMEHPTIDSLTVLASQKGVPAEELGALITAITPHKWQLEAVQGMLWSECWDGLSSRLPQIVQKIMQEYQQ